MGNKNSKNYENLPLWKKIPYEILWKVLIFIPIYCWPDVFLAESNFGEVLNYENFWKECLQGHFPKNEILSSKERIDWKKEFIKIVKSSKKFILYTSYSFRGEIFPNTTDTPSDYGFSIIGTNLFFSAIKSSKIRICFVGDEECGKSSYISDEIEKKQPNKKKKLGDFHRVLLLQDEKSISSSRNLEITLIDCEEKDYFCSSLKSFCENSAITLFFVNLAKKRPFSYLEKVLNEPLATVLSYSVIFLICTIPDKSFVVDKHEINHFCKKYNFVNYLITSNSEKAHSFYQILRIGLKISPIYHNIKRDYLKH